jgi:hypothetical protein
MSLTEGRPACNRIAMPGGAGRELFPSIPVREIIKSLRYVGTSLTTRLAESVHGYAR